MKYDFTTLPNRREQPSNKWRAALQKMDLPTGVIPFTTADMEFQMPPEIISGLKEFLDKMILGYTYADEGFFAALYSWMKERHNFEIKPEWAVMTTGVVPAFFTAVKTLTQKGDGVVIMPPVYPPFFMSAKKQARYLIKCPLLSDDKGYYEIDFDRFKKICKTKKPKVLLFCSPHNPVGRVWKKAELETLAEICLEHDVFMLVDEIHHDLVMPGHKHTVLQTIASELSKRIITHTSLSKTFNLAGMMLSVNFIPDENLRKQFNTVIEKTGMHVCTALGFKAYEIAYTKCADWLDEAIKVIDTNMHLVSESLTNTKVKAPISEGTYLQWLNFQGLKLNDEELAKFLQNKALLFLNEGHTFGKEGSGFARWNLAAPTETIREAVERLKKLL